MKSRFLFLLICLIIFANITTVAAKNFSDIKNHKYQSAIEFLTNEQIIGGYPDGTFKPEKTINRAELLKIALKNQTALETKNCFKDVKKDIWYAKYVCKGHELKIVKGYTDGFFRPEQTINFVEALKIIMLSYDLPYSERIGEKWYEASINTAKNLNFIPPDIKTHDQALSRAQAAELLTRIIKYTKARIPVKSSAPTPTQTAKPQPTITSTPITTPTPKITSTPHPAIDDTTARINLKNYLAHPISNWTYKIPLDLQDILNFIIVTPGTIVKNHPLTISFDFLPSYRDNVRSVSFSITDINNTEKKLTFKTSTSKESQLVINLSPQQVNSLGTANCIIENIDVTLKDGTKKSVNVRDITNNAPICFSGIMLAEDYENYTVFDQQKLFLIIPKELEQHGEGILRTANKCYGKVEELLQEKIIPEKTIIIIEKEAKGFATAAFGHVNMDNYNLDKIAAMKECNDPVFAHELTHVLVAHTPIPGWANEGLATYTSLRIRNDQSITCNANSYTYENAITPYVNLQTFAQQQNLDYITAHCFWKFIEQDHGKQAVQAVIKKLVEARNNGKIIPGCSPTWTTFLQETVLPATNQAFIEKVKKAFGLIHEAEGKTCTQ